MKGAVALLVLAVISLASAGAAAQGSEGLARERYEQGLRHVDAGDYRAAFGAFEEGHRLSGRRLFLFNMAECAREGGELGVARRLYARYLEAEPDGAMSGVATGRLRELAPDGATSTGVRRPPPADTTSTDSAPTDTASSNTAPPSDTVLSEPPRISGAANGGRVPSPLDAALTVAEPEEREPSVFETWWFWTIVGAVVVAGLAVTLALTVPVDEVACGGACVDLR